MKQTRRWGLYALLALAPSLGACDSVAPAPGSKPSGTSLGRASAPAGDQPKIACDKASHQYGTVSQGATVEHVYTVKNVGGAPLTITRATGG